MGGEFSYPKMVPVHICGWVVEVLYVWLTYLSVWLHDRDPQDCSSGQGGGNGKGQFDDSTRFTDSGLNGNSTKH